MIEKSFTLNNEYEIPALFYGTYRRGQELRCLLDCALTAGYRGIDTAAFYKNEFEIRETLETLLPKHGLKREDIFITTKLPPKCFGQAAAIAALQKSKTTLVTPYLDLYLVHWPGLKGPFPRVKTDDPRGVLADIRRQTWQILETRVLEEKQVDEENGEDLSTVIKGSGSYRCIRSLGVSNYLPRHIEEMAGYATVKPAVIQYEYHPYLSVEAQERPMRRICDRLFPDIHFQAHTTLANGSRELLTSQVVQELAAAHQKTPAQVILRWSLQRGHSLVVNSSDPRHIAENTDVFDWELTADAVSRINAMERNQRTCWDPNAIL